MTDTSERKTDRELTKQQQAFVLHFTSTDGASGSPTKAARLAGYSTKYATDIGRQLLAKPHVQAAIDAELREKIATSLTVQAIGVIETIIKDTSASLKLRGDMAVKVIEFSGLVERTKAEKEKQTGLAEGKKLTELTREELERVVSQGAEVLKLADELAKQSARPN